jgi:hypothetical protein
VQIAAAIVFAVLASYLMLAASDLSLSVVVGPMPEHSLLALGRRHRQDPEVPAANRRALDLQIPEPTPP